MTKKQIREEARKIASVIIYREIDVAKWCVYQNRDGSLDDVYSDADRDAIEKELRKIAAKLWYEKK